VENCRKFESKVASRRRRVETQLALISAGGGTSISAAAPAQDVHQRRTSDISIEALVPVPTIIIPPRWGTRLLAVASVSARAITVPGEFVVAGSDPAEVLELAQEVLDEVALTIEHLAETGFSFAIGFGRDVGRRALFLDQRADAVGIVGLVGKHDHVRPEMVAQFVGSLPVMRLPSSQAERIGRPCA
jgi:hypothetical protein